LASKQTTVDFILEQIAPAGSVTARKMFGEYALYRKGNVVALICDDQLFLKITSAGKSFLSDCEEASPYPGAKPCFLIPGDKWEDRGWMSELFSITTADLAKPNKKPRKKKAGRKTGESQKI
jgi:TfoX/Sxy family transcriptional regulator of competence genes